jgi:Flp pilus assembly protein TadD
MKKASTTLWICALGLEIVMPALRAQQLSPISTQCSEPPANVTIATVSVQQLRTPSKAARELREGLKLRTVQPEEAISHFQKAIQVYPNYSSAYVQLGLTLMDKRQWEEAEIALHRAIDVDPNSSEANTALGILLNRRAEFEEAGPVLRRAAQLDPRSASAHYELGLSYWGVHAFQQAECEARISVELEPNFGGSRVLLGAALLNRNSTTIATEQLRRALLLDPDGPLSQSTRAILEKLRPGVGTPKADRSSRRPLQDGNLQRPFCF